MQTVLISEDKKQFIVNESILESMSYDDEIIRKILFNIKQQKLSIPRNETLGLLFQKLVKKEERKNLGQFYTPQEIVDYIINSLNINANSKILDPTCGCGIFLVSAYNTLKQIKENAMANIYGVDLNDTATKLTRINLWLRSNQSINSLETVERNIKVGNSIVCDKTIDQNAFDWLKEFPEIFDEGGFDFIIGNPPYLTIKDRRDYNSREYNLYKITNGNVNAASLVIVRSFELLKKGGIMAFVLPKTLLRVNSYFKLREFLLYNSKILQIYDLGSCFKKVRGEQIILFIQKPINKEEIINNKIFIRVFNNKKKSLFEQNSFTIPQSVYKNYQSFLVFEDAKNYKLIEKIDRSGKDLGELSEIFRGLCISPKSPIISLKNGANKIPLIKGNNISKFSYITTYFIKNESLNNNCKMSKFKNPKIIMQNIFSSEAGIIATIDKKGCITFDTVTNILIKDKNIDLRYILGLLNSKLINYYLMYAIYNKSKLTMHTDKIYLEKLPIKLATKEEQQKIIRLVGRIKQSSVKNEYLKKLDDLVYKLYGINNNEVFLINNALSKIMSNKSMW